MASALQPRCIPLVEPVPIDNEFASGAALVRSIDGMTYLVFYVENIQPPELGESRDRVITRRLIIPNKSAKALGRMLECALTLGPHDADRCFCDGAHTRT